MSFTFPPNIPSNAPSSVVTQLNNMMLSGLVFFGIWCFLTFLGIVLLPISGIFISVTILWILSLIVWATMIGLVYNIINGYNSVNVPPSPAPQ